MEKFHMTNLEADALAKRMDAELDLSKHGNYMVRKATELMPNIDNKASLDVGTGEGRWARYMEDIMHASPVVAIDNNPTMIEIAKNKSRNNNVKYLDVEIDDLSIRNFEYINVFFVTNYIYNLNNFFKQARERLNIDGQLLLSAKSVNIQKNIHETLLLPISLPGGYTMQSYPHSTQRYIESVENAGLIITECDVTKDTGSSLDKKWTGSNVTIENLILLCKKTSHYG